MFSNASEILEITFAGSSVIPSGAPQGVLVEGRATVVPDCQGNSTPVRGCRSSLDGPSTAYAPLGMTEG
jgi:hypothetical protein